MGTMIQPAVLKYVPMKRQCILQIIYLFVYLIFGYYFTIEYGLVGFCFAVILANSLKVVLLIGQGEIYFDK
jgi:multisubunit Na+/H+ antiporter MnhE subunit